MKCVLRSPWERNVKQSEAQETNTPAPHPSNKIQVTSGAAGQDECLEELRGKPWAYFVWKPDAV